jgi:hypothetical protein
MPNAFKKLSAIAAPIMRSNVDTDVVIRIERLVGTSFVARSANGRSNRCVICRINPKIPNSFSTVSPTGRRKSW